MEEKRIYFPHVHIRGFKLLSDLQIDQLSPINLIAGDNNVGKSTLLEALYVLASGGSMDTLRQIACERMDLILGRMDDRDIRQVIRQIDKQRVLLPFFKDCKFELGEEICLQASERQFVKMRLIYAYETEEVTANSVIKKINYIADSQQLSKTDEKLEKGIYVRSGKKEFFYSLEDEFRFSEKVILPNVHFVHTVSSSKDMNARLWDNISLTGLEQHVVDALRIIEPQIENLAFLEEPEVSLFSGRTRRVPYVSLRNGNNRYPLSIMGDGMNRILSIILAIVNSKNGICLIDEIENGIYYRKQLDLWKIIFFLVDQLNVQLFATTHSLDCVRSFSSMAENGNGEMNQLIRLEKRKKGPFAICYAPQELKVALDNEIELR